MDFQEREVLDHRWLNSHRYGVVDAGNRDSLPTQLASTPIAPSFLGEDTSRCPLLVDLRSLSADEGMEVFEQLEAEVNGRTDALISLLLECAAPAETLVRHLSSRLAIQWPGEVQPKQFRFFDPGTFLQLPRVLGIDGMAWLMGPVESVVALWAGHWMRFDRPRQRGAFRFHLEHFEALSRIGVVNRVALQQKSIESGAEWVRTCAWLDTIVLRAIERHELRRQGDLVAFTRHAIERHPNFDDHPQMRAVFGRLKVALPDDELDYEELTTAMSEQDWQAICHDLTTIDPKAANTRGSKT